MAEKEPPLKQSDLGSERFWKTPGTLDLDTPSDVESDNPEEVEKDFEKDVEKDKDDDQLQR